MRRAALVFLLAAVPAALAGQGLPELRVERGDGSFRRVPLGLAAGYATVPVSLFEELGWSVSQADRTLTLSVPGEIEVALRLGSPFFRWDDVVLQLTDAPHDMEGEPHVPLQLLTDFFPRRLPGLYDFDGPNATLRAGDPGTGTAPTVSVDAPEADPDRGAGDAEAAPPLEVPSAYSGERLVVIDAGHGGEDPGALGPAGIREKAVALGIALEVERRLRGREQLAVHMIRDDDTFVEVWDRGEIATALRGERPAIFVSIHANSFPQRRAASGFETYFLSEARTEHERRVAANENAAISVRGEGVDADQPDLDFILRELRNLDHSHWSSLLAEMIQEELAAFHPGPNRGVKQGPLAVLTNALMPSVLVEVGYLSHADEGRLLGETGFQAQAAEAIADAVLRFFERYPPGSDFGGRERP